MASMFHVIVPERTHTSVHEAIARMLNVNAPNRIDEVMTPTHHAVVLERIRQPVSEESLARLLHVGVPEPAIASANPAFWLCTINSCRTNCSTKRNTLGISLHLIKSSISGACQYALSTPYSWFFRNQSAGRSLVPSYRRQA